jgi:crotonobetainyl-CoA:carnitine CoA-transferase CaiB-like acyl-CoA transferase
MESEPLRGVRVLDFTQGIAGPFATKLMGALGADVIKVEPPGLGDSARSLPPFLQDDPHPEKSGLFLYLNTNKRSITLDMHTADGQHVARSLLEGIDIVIEDYPPGQLAEWDLGFETIERINPRTTLVSVTPFGQTGPYRDYASSDLVAQALGGLLYVTGDPEREPLRIGGSPAEYLAGCSAFSGALIALTYRDASGRGQHVDVSELDGIATAQQYASLTYAYLHENRERVAAPPLFRVKDGQVGASFRQQSWGEVCQMIGRPELEGDERFIDMDARRENGEELNSIVGEWMRDQPKEALYHRAQEAGMAWGYICDAEDLITSPQYVHREYFVEIDHPVAGPLTYPGMPLRWSGEVSPLQRAPLLGEHNTEIYCGQLGWTRERLVAKRAAGTV